MKNFDNQHCYHGGAFFNGIGDEFDNLHRRRSVISADVLDAWFPPSPGVIDALREHLSWIIRTSPPTNCGGLQRTIARVRGVPTEAVLPGAGSSDLIFLALRQWITSRSNALILDPTYGEYAHLLERVIGCRVDRFPLDPDRNFHPDPDELSAALMRGYDLAVIVNPNSPTGVHIPGRLLEKILLDAPPTTRFWIDETYVEYVGSEQSLESFAATHPNVIVCKSMSKVYALSGVRAAYLCADPDQLRELRSISPPWSVGLPAQVAAVHALRDPDHYAECYRRTHLLRRSLAQGLHSLGLHTYPGTANFLLCRLPGDGPDAAALVKSCRRRGLYLRDVASMGRVPDEHTFRIAVRDEKTNRRMVGILKEVLQSCPDNSRSEMGVQEW